MPQLNPYVTFNGNARTAMEFYHACLGGELSIMTVGDSPMKDQMPAETQNNVMHSRLKSDGIELLASDMMGPGELVRGNGIALCIVGRIKEEIQESFTRLAEGGTVSQLLEEMFFGFFGELTDKFGIRWIFQADNAKRSRKRTGLTPFLYQSRHIRMG